MKKEEVEIVEVEDNRFLGFENFRTSQHQNCESRNFPSPPEYDLVLASCQQYGTPYPTARDVYGKLATYPVCHCHAEDGEFLPEWKGKFIVFYDSILRRKSDEVFGFAAFKSEDGINFQYYFVPMGATLTSVHWALVYK